MSNSSGGGARRLGGEEARDLEVLERREADEEEEGRPEDRAVVDPRKRRRMAMEILIVYCARDVCGGCWFSVVVYVEKSRRIYVAMVVC